MDKKQKMWIADNGDGTYTNPILYTDYSDPDAIRVGEEYFMIASSFCNSPAIPVLHSKDLVNWKVISYALDKIPFADYDTPQHGRGVWAPAIRYHDNQFWIFFPMPDEGIFCCTTKDPFQGWSEPFCVRKVVGWIDPCPFWDEDGKAYMVTAFARSRIGFKSILHLSTIRPDCTETLDDGRHIFDGNKTQPTIEGPKLYKRNGYYYIFAPAGGVKTGWQTVLRSKNIWGPYEERIVMHQGNTSVNGPHQGAWIDTPSGENWFLHFQDVGNAGRIVHLQPMKWVDDWPVIGINENENGCGEPVSTYQKPNVKASSAPDAPDDSDDFSGATLGLQWQWNANYKKSWYEINTDKKRLALYAQHWNSSLPLCDIPNLLLQKWPAPEFEIHTKLYLGELKEHDIAGLVCLGGVYTSIAVQKQTQGYELIQITGELEQKQEIRKKTGFITEQTIEIKMIVRKAKAIQFVFTKDGEEWIEIGDMAQTTPGKWVGVKSGLFCYNPYEKTNGYIEADYFIYNKLD